MIRLFDILFSCIGLIILSPLFAVVAIWIKLDSIGPVFYRQIRVGKNDKDFRIFKFRSMRVGSDTKGLITVGGKDMRVTRAGYFLRKYKVDELPQLLNVFVGDMSLVGPRPEVRKYVDLYTPEQLKVLSVRPGITDYASVEYVDENEILGAAEDSERTYIEQILPDKIRYNMKYINHQTLGEYFKIIWLTFLSIFR
ncbi:MAG: sugar transferase [Sphingobacteriia bacterium]|jgi:lipopolysaccharide/colanic/teichoic acid biosynthesis glycosyltransferase|nr:sugar transferase [Paludibacteraceae bacterium]NCA79094.1 sugar transferase [Sphingobacteriia bacterium]